MAVVVDTNVLATANDYADHASPGCVVNCVRELRQIRDAEAVVVDDEERVFGEYRFYASPSGQPGPGDFFFKWLWDNQGNLDHCVPVHVTQHYDGVCLFDEFPDDPDLAGFDRADQVWVAIALASGLQPVIVNATDRDWWHHREAIERHGLEINFLCPDLMQA